MLISVLRVSDLVETRNGGTLVVRIRPFWILYFIITIVIHARGKDGRMWSRNI